jgi:hypothetical protein
MEYEIFQNKIRAGDQQLVVYHGPCQIVNVIDPKRKPLLSPALPSIIRAPPTPKQPIHVSNHHAPQPWGIQRPLTHPPHRPRRLLAINPHRRRHIFRQLIRIPHTKHNQHAQRRQTTENREPRSLSLHTAPPMLASGTPHQERIQHLKDNGSRQRDDSCSQPVALLMACEGNASDAVAAAVSDFVFLAVTCCYCDSKVAKRRGAPAHADVMLPASTDGIFEAIEL